MFDWYAEGKKAIRQVKEPEFSSLGFTKLMTLEQARDWCTRLNHENKTERIENKRHKILNMMDVEEKKAFALLPEALVREFETLVLLQRYAFGDKGSLEKNKLLCHWRAAKRMLLELNKTLKIKPEELAEQPEYLLNYILAKDWSLSYCRKLIRIINLWNKFFCKKTGKYFEEIPNPKGKARQRVSDNYSREHGLGKRSDALDIKTLEQQKENLIPAQYAWLYVSAWFGLRPNEVDNLTLDRTSWKLMKQQGYDVLCIRQDKLTAIPVELRWKLIPLKYPEQALALELLKKGEMARPLPKTCRKYLGDTVMTYGGRKAFEDLMTERGEPIANISIWLGHTNIRTTDQHYRNRLKAVI